MSWLSPPLAALTRAWQPQRPRPERRRKAAPRVEPLEDRLVLSGWSQFTLSGPGSAAPYGGVAAVSRASNTMETFWVVRDGSVQDGY
jgi:hypothetical protein